MDIHLLDWLFYIFLFILVWLIIPDKLREFAHTTAGFFTYIGMTIFYIILFAWIDLNVVDFIGVSESIDIIKSFNVQP